MKSFITTVGFAIILAGCGGGQQAESERKLAEAQQKLEEATKALQEAQRTAGQNNPAPTQPAAPESSAVAKARGEVAKSADEVAAAARTVRQTNVAQKSDDTREQNRKAAEAEAKAEEARRLAAKPVLHTVPQNTPVKIRTTNQLSTKTNQSGDAFEASLAAPIEVDGYVVAERGAPVQGVITTADDGGRVKGRAVMTLTLRHLTLADGRKVAIQTDGETQQATSSVKKDSVKVGIASGIGAAIGAIAGGGKGAAIGAGAGAAGGTGLVLATKGNAAVIPAESVLTFRLTAPLTVQETPGQNRAVPR